jgi:hypothetical protein
MVLKIIVDGCAQWLMTVISATQEAEIGRTTVQGQLRQKVCETPISTNKNLGVVTHASHPSQVGSVNRRIMVQASQASARA